MKNIQFIFRRIKKNRTATTLGVAGLVAGMMCVIYIFLLTTDEISYDRFHRKSDRVFVVHAYLDEGNGQFSFDGCPPAVAPALKADYPEVETSCRYIPAYFRSLFSYEGEKYTERTAMADYSFFDIFTFPFVYGGRGDSAVTNQVILTQETARKYFGDTNPVGKVMKMENRADMTVVGVIKDIPDNSSISFDALIPLENIGYYFGRSDYLTSWYNNAFTTFGLLKDPHGFDKIASTITRRIQKEIPESTNYLRAYRFRDQYLYEKKHINEVRIFILIAFLVLLAATLNFINLNTARSVNQAKETGLRKTFGASRSNVVRLIYQDIAMVVLFAFILAVIFDYSGLPLINRLTGKSISFDIIFSPGPMIILILIYLFTVLFAGSYPAFFLSSFTPGQILNSNYQSIRRKGIFRNTLVVTMFVISIILLSSTLVISKQTLFLQKMDLGFNKDHIMYVSLKGNLSGQVSTLKEEIGRVPGVVSSTAVSNLPVMIGNNGETWSWEGKDPSFKPLVTEWNTDEDMLKTLGATMYEGEFLGSDRSGIVINKTFADIIGWDSFTGKTIKNFDTPYNIIGVINDIHFNSLSATTKPMVIEKSESYGPNYLLIKLNTADLINTVNYVTKACVAVEPSFPVEYSFLDESYNQLLASEINLKKLVGVFSIFAILVLCLGMLGMIMFIIEQRTKEVGIRKCLGENILPISGKLISPFMVTGVVASLIAIPAAWFIMKHWLAGYAYHITLNPWLFIISALIIIFIALLTVFWQSMNAAMKNPVEALRYE